jgi:methyl-accepting chemotaxis protein
LTKANFTLYEPNKPDQDGEEYEYNPLTPNEFNKIVDKAYIAKDTTDDIDLNTFELWDSTAWIKIIDKEQSKFKYIKIANLNVLAPTFTVDTNLEHEPTTTFSDDYSNGTFNVPSITPGENASFIIKFPPPMDIDIAVDTSSDSTENIVDSVSSQYIDKNTKKFTLDLPSIGNTISEANEAISEANEAVSEANAAASEANSAASAANRAAADANAAASNVGDNIKNVFSSG